MMSSYDVKLIGKKNIPSQGHGGIGKVQPVCYLDLAKVGPDLVGLLSDSTFPIQPWPNEMFILSSTCDNFFFQQY